MSHPKLHIIVWVGDLVVIGLITLYGFASHGELQEAGLRLLSTFIPLLLAWLIVGLPAGLFDALRALQASQLWRPFWGMLIAGPLAVLLRSTMLEFRPILPTFAFVLTGVSAVAIMGWRIVFFLLFKGKSVNDK